MTYTKEAEQAQEPQLPDSGNIKNEKAPKSRRNLFLALGGGALATTILVTGLFILPKGERGGTAPDEKSDKGTSQSDKPVASDTPKPVKTGEAQTGTGEFTGKIAEQTETIAQMDAIQSVDEFAKLPFADRYAYAVAKNPNLAVATPDNDQGYANPSMIPGYYWFSVDGSAMNNGNTLEGAKVISANEYYGTDRDDNKASDAYKASSDSVLQNGGAGVAIAETDVFVDSGKWQSGKDRDGNAIDFINITSYQADASSGDRKGNDITYQTIRQEIKLLDGKTVIAYARGYGIEGKQSPVEGGTY